MTALLLLFFCLAVDFFTSSIAMIDEEFTCSCSCFLEVLTAEECSLIYGQTYNVDLSVRHSG